MCLNNIDNFNEALVHGGLVSVGFEGFPFTWTNGQVWRRLDRVLINDDWEDAFALTRVLHKP